MRESPISYKPNGERHELKELLVRIFDIDIFKGFYYFTILSLCIQKTFINNISLSVPPLERFQESYKNYAEVKTILESMDALHLQFHKKIWLYYANNVRQMLQVVHHQVYDER